jgi:tripartite-type tricarboxylate transporter receptor subunit TctC
MPHRPMIPRRAALAALPAAAAALARRARAQPAAFPSRPVQVVVPFAPGGSPDIAARLLAPRMADLLGQPVVVENRPGAGSTVGSRSVLGARPDGHTLMMGPISFLTAPLTMDPPPFDTVQSFRVVTHLATVPFVLVVRPDFPARTLAEFHAHVAANPGRLNYGSSGNGTPLHLGGEMYRLMTGAQIQHVAYRGTAPALADLIAGQVQMVFADLPGAAGQIRAGAVRPLASLVRGRIAALPEVPSMAESDPSRLAEYEVYTWTMLVAPKATPDGVVRRLNEAVLAAARAPEAAPRLAEMGFDLVASTPEEGDAFLAREQAKWGALIRRAGIRAEF